MNSFLKEALAREGDLVACQRKLTADLERVAAELVVVRKVKRFYSHGDTSRSGAGFPRNGPGKLMALVMNAVDKMQGKFDHFSVKVALEQAHPGSEFSVKQIGKALYKLGERKPPVLKVARRGRSRQPNIYEKA